MNINSSNNTSAVRELQLVAHETVKLSGCCSELNNIDNISNSQADMSSDVSSGAAGKKRVLFNEFVDLYYFDRTKELDNTPREKLSRQEVVYRRFMDYQAKEKGLFFAAGHDSPCESRPSGYDHEYALSQMALL